MRLGGLTVLMVVAAIAGCGERGNGQGAAPAQGPPRAAAEARYEAKPEEGIDFRKPGLPAFVAEVSGLSGWEAWGRWSDANLAPGVRIRFTQPLPPAPQVELSIMAFGPNLGQPIRVRIGSVERSITHSNAGSAGTYTVRFETSGGADTLEIVPPQPISPAQYAGTQDVRRIGVGLVSVRVRE